MDAVSRDVARELGLPAIADIHVHFMPERVMAAVWRHFDEAGPLLGREWPVRYRGSDEERVAVLRDHGVGLFAGLSYAHKPGMAQYLTEWSVGFAERTPEAVATGTFYPEPGVLDYVAAAVESGVQLFKVHVQVGEFDPTDAALDDVWGLLDAVGIPVVVHAGSGPVRGRFTGPGLFGDVMERHPGLMAIVAHLGMPEEREFLDMVSRYPRLGLDLTMVGTDFMEQMHALDPEVLPRIKEAGLTGRVFFGTDFPNIPYPYDHQIEVILRWDMGDDWLRHVLWLNAARLFGAG